MVLDDYRTRTAYLMAEMATGTGRLWAVKRRDTGSVYWVVLDKMAFACDCQGHARYRHCRHADGIRWLHDAGNLRIVRGLYPAA